MGVNMEAKMITSEMWEESTHIVPDGVQSIVTEAIRTNQWLVIAICIKDGRIQMDRHEKNFPRADADSVIELVANDMLKLKGT